MPKRLLISGRVQGVGFRHTMAMEAIRIGVTGWVRNRRDGSVEAIVDGSDEAIESIVAWARIGPRAAQVVSVEVAEAAGAFSAFEQRPTV